MSRAKSKQQNRSIGAKLGKRPRGAANVLNREAVPRRSEVAQQREVGEEGAEIYWIGYIERAAKKLFSVRPSSHAFKVSVPSNRLVSDEIGPNGQIAVVPKINVTFVESTPAHWWFDGRIAFIHGELYEGTRPVRAALLETDEGRDRLAAIIVDHVREEHPWMAERLAHLHVKGGAEELNLVVDVALSLRDEQEERFSDLVVQLQRLNGAASIEMAKGGLGHDRDTAPKRAAIAAARDVLARVREAAESERQLALALRVKQYEETWSRWEESLDRIDAFRSAGSLAEGTRAARDLLRTAALRSRGRIT